jgi:hypothetical protein
MGKLVAQVIDLIGDQLSSPSAMGAIEKVHSACAESEASE